MWEGQQGSNHEVMFWLVRQDLDQLRQIAAFHRLPQHNSKQRYYNES